VPETLTIPARYNGPPASANGGYTCGLVAGLVGGEEVSVSLRLPPPVDKPLSVVRDGDQVELRDGDARVAEGGPAELLLEVPDPISPEEAAAASAAGRSQWCDHHPFPTCFACGPQRNPGDGLRLFPGELRDGIFATPWTPDDTLDDGTGHVRPECVWAALDCPTSAPVGGSVEVGEHHAILSWPLSVDGRKHAGACALFDSAGRLLCASQALWIEVRQE
jgi:hypothetical protein